MKKLRKHYSIYIFREESQLKKSAVAPQIVTTAKRLMVPLAPFPEEEHRSSRAQSHPP